MRTFSEGFENITLLVNGVRPCLSIREVFSVPDDSSGDLGTLFSQVECLLLTFFFYCLFHVSTAY